MGEVMEVMPFDEKRAFVEKYVNEHNPYESNRLPKFDLRGYARYLEENNSNGEHCTERCTKIHVYRKIKKILSGIKRYAEYAISKKLRK